MVYNPVLSGELKCFRLRHARKVGTRNLGMSSVVRVRDSVGIGLVDITFESSLVETIGKHLPRGAGPDDPVFLRAEEQLDGTWNIYGQYIRSREYALLWIAPAQPHWIRHVRRFDNH